MGSKKRTEQFLQKRTNSASKKCVEKNRRKKVRENVFYINTNVVIKKLGVKNLLNIFP